MVSEGHVESIVLHTASLVEIATAQKSVRSLGKLCNEISKHYRAIGICGLLMNADVRMFFQQLCHAALTRLYYLRGCAEEDYLEDPYRKASFVGPFLDAVAVNQFDLAKQIAALSPKNWCTGYEYEDDFAWAAFLYELVQFEKGAEGGLNNILDQYEKALEGNSDVRLEICYALKSRNQDEFNKAFVEFLNAYDDKMAELTDPRTDSILSLDFTFEPNRWIFVEGLAILRIAERIGLSTEDEYKLCPKIVRLEDFGPFEPNSFPYLDLGG